MRTVRDTKEWRLCSPIEICWTLTMMICCSNWNRCLPPTAAWTHCQIERLTVGPIHPELRHTIAVQTPRWSRFICLNDTPIDSAGIGRTATNSRPVQLADSVSRQLGVSVPDVSITFAKVVGSFALCIAARIDYTSSTSGESVSAWQRRAINDSNRFTGPNRNSKNFDPLHSKRKAVNSPAIGWPSIIYTFITEFNTSK